VASYYDEFVVKPGSTVELSAVDPGVKPKEIDKPEGKAALDKNAEKLEKLQYLLYAENRLSLLICLQGPDAAGKDGTISHVAHTMNPQGTRVHSFKVPSLLEASHDFLWRAHAQAPAKGELVIFNRSHYEDVLVARVHNLVPESVWQKRYDLINDFEKNLVENGTHILKFFLHISPDVQLARFGKRLEDPKRQWKISEADYTEQKLWPDYTKAYEAALSKTSTKHAPWFIVPSNHKWSRNLIVSQILVETLESLDMKTPAPSVDLDEIRRKYHEALDSELIKQA
jgi:PPK2 family polyphosphate:nucleotide phosphotransferase